MHLFRYLILIQDKNDKSKLVTWQYSFINTEDIQVWLRIRLSRLVLEFERRKIGSESIFFIFGSLKDLIDLFGNL